MPRLYLALFLLLSLPGYVFAQNGVQAVHLYNDRVNQTDKLWLYHDGDAMAYADRGFNDSMWRTQSTRLNLENMKAPFSGKAWFRLHFTADSEMAKSPIALYLTQSGASEIYLDGKQIVSLGKVGDTNSTSSYNPKMVPVVFSLGDGGMHVLAVRYANWNAWRYLKKYQWPQAGFKMELVNANEVLAEQERQVIVWSVLFLFFSTLFFSFALVHGLLYFYHRADRSNLWFSIFSVCMALLFLSVYVIRLNHSMQAELRIRWWLLPLVLGACLSMSGLINCLFTRARLRFYLIGVGCIGILILENIDVNLALIGVLILISVVALEAVIIIIQAIVRRVPGARIVGAGILFFALLLLSLYIIVLGTGGKADLSDNTPQGFVLFLLLIAAILSVPVSMSAYLAWNFARVSRNLSAQLREVERLSARALEQEADKQRLLENRREELEREVALRTVELRAQKKKSDDLLLNILPEEIAEELKETGQSVARMYDNVSVLFTDFVNFTQMSEHLTPAALVAEIDTCFKAFDDIITRHGLEKIKTVGDAYIAVSGLPADNPRHAEDVVKAALDIKAYMEDRRNTLPDTFGIRLGIHSGPVVAGIVGVKKFAYDIWGDTVNTAARMEQHGEAGKLNISGATYDLVKERFNCVYRGDIEAKHKGAMRMYFLLG
jgi:class 3 adenylate cyclase